MDSIEKILAELLTDFEVLAKERKTYKWMLDDAICTSKAHYVTESTVGFFPDQRQPAYLCVRALVYLLRAASGEKITESLASASSDIEKAQWDGTNMNNGEIKKNFLQLRQDANSRGEEEYNQKLAELYNTAGELFQNARGKKDPVHENIFAAMAQLATACSKAYVGPYNFSAEEQQQGLTKAETMVKFALNKSKNM